MTAVTLTAEVVGGSQSVRDSIHKWSCPVIKQKCDMCVDWELLNIIFNTACTEVISHNKIQGMCSTSKLGTSCNQVFQ